jgi:hypothetical protein
MTTNKIALVALACFLASPLEAKELIWDSWLKCWSSSYTHICDITPPAPLASQGLPRGPVTPAGPPIESGPHCIYDGVRWNCPAR